MQPTTIKSVPAPRLVCVELNPGPFDNETRSKIVWWKNDVGLSTHAIAKKYNSEPKIIRNVLKKYRETGSVANRPGQGRKRKLNPQQERAVVKKLKRGKNSTRVAREVSQKLKQPISPRTIRRIGNKGGAKYLVVEEQDLLTEEHKRKRVEFARRRAKHDWTFTLFTDEKTFQVGGGPHKMWQDPKRRRTREVVRHPKKIHVWGGIGYYYKTKLYFFEENLDSKLYQNILRLRLPPESSPDCPEGRDADWIFVQDLDPKHRAKSTNALLDEVAPDRMKDFPAKSPEINIIEDMWSAVTRAIEHYNITSVAQLKRLVNKAWNELPWELVRKSVNSVPRRLKAIIKAKGERVKY
jgi:transposase